MSPELRHRLFSRARGQCECGCGAFVPPGECDHFFGRAKAEESEATCWVLTPRCHFAKTRNSPDGGYWLERFIVHCDRWGYNESVIRARARLEMVTTRHQFNRALLGRSL